MLLKLFSHCLTLSVWTLWCTQTALAQADTDLGKSFSQATSISQLTHDSTQRSSRGHELQVIATSPAHGDISARFLVQGGLHGNEGGASAFVLWLASRYVKGQSLLNQLGPAVAIDFMPYANPDGELASTRSNERGVNLNRNFDVLWGVSRENPGSTSFSEAETKAIRSLFAARHYTGAVDVHGYINWIVAPSSPEAITALGFKPDAERIALYRRWRLAFKQEMPVLPGYQLKTGAALGDGGAFEDWAFWRQGVLAHCLEIESAERFASSYRPDFNHFASLALRALQESKVDTFKRYEAFVYRMFAQAMKIKQMPVEPATLAGK